MYSVNSRSQHLNTITCSHVWRVVCGLLITWYCSKETVFLWWVLAPITSFWRRSPPSLIWPLPSISSAYSSPSLLFLSFHLSSPMSCLLLFLLHGGSNLFQPEENMTTLVKDSDYDTQNNHWATTNYAQGVVKSHHGRCTEHTVSLQAPSWFL